MNLADFVENVKSAIHDKFIYHTVGNSLKLIEVNNLTPKPGVDIKNLCREVYINLEELDNPLVLQIDLVEVGLKLHPLLKAGNDTGINRKCDYIIICQHEGKIYIIVIELKSKKEGHWRSQCVIGESLIHYVISALDRTSGTHYRAVFEYRHLLFTTDSKLVHKRPTGNKPAVYRYNSYVDAYYSIQRCNNPSKLALPLKNFLVEAEIRNKKK